MERVRQCPAYLLSLSEEQELSTKSYGGGVYVPFAAGDYLILLLTEMKLSVDIGGKEKT